MSSRTPSRRLQGEQPERAAIRIRLRAPMALLEQPIDGVQIVARTGVRLRTFGACRAFDVVTVHAQRHHHRPVTEAGGGQQRDRHRVRDRAGLGAHRKHIALRGHDNRPATHDRMLLRQSPRLFHRIGEQHRLQGGVGPTGKLANQLQQPLEPVGIAPHPLDEPRIGHHARFEHAGRCRHGRHAIADGMCQPAQQFVMNGEPSFRPDWVRRLAAF